MILHSTALPTAIWPPTIASYDYVKNHDAIWHKCLDAEPLNYLPPRHYGTQTIDMVAQIPEKEFPEMGVLEIKNSTVYGGYGWIYSPEGQLFSNHAWYGDYLHEPSNHLPVPATPPPGEKLPGITLSLVSEFSIYNYGHFLLDSMSRLALFRKAGMRLADVDHILCPRPRSPAGWELLKYFKIPQKKCIWINLYKSKSICPETLIAPSYPGTRQNYPAWVPAFLKSVVAPNTPPGTRRLYISRESYSRNPTNLDAFKRILKKYEFEDCKPETLANPHQVFSEANIVVGAHGGGLSHLVFCNPNTKVLELVPTDHVLPHYYTISWGSKFDYSYIACRSVEHKAPGNYLPSRSDFYLEEDVFEEALRDITQSQ